MNNLKQLILKFLCLFEGVINNRKVAIKGNINIYNNKLLI